MAMQIGIGSKGTRIIRRVDDELADDGERIGPGKGAADGVEEDVDHGAFVGALGAGSSRSSKRRRTEVDSLLAANGSVPTLIEPRHRRLARSDEDKSSESRESHHLDAASLVFTP
jgi:hypothetical protein